MPLQSPLENGRCHINFFSSVLQGSHFTMFGGCWLSVGTEKEGSIWHVSTFIFLVSKLRVLVASTSNSVPSNQHVPSERCSLDNRAVH